MISPPSTWTHAHNLMEGAGERRLIREACLCRNVGQRRPRLYQEILGALNPALHEPSVSGDTEARFEGPGKVADRKAALLCDLREPYSTGQILVQQLRRTALLPRPQAADSDRGWFSQSAVLLEQMSAEDQIQVVQCQGERPAWLPDVGKDALGQLAQHEVFFQHRHSVGLHRTHAKISRDVVQALARHMKQHVVEGVSHPATRLRIKIDYVGPERWNVGCWYGFVVDPELTIGDR